MSDKNLMKTVNSFLKTSFKAVKISTLTFLVFLFSFATIIAQCGLAVYLTENAKLSYTTEFLLLAPMALLSIFISVKSGQQIGVVSRNNQR